MNSPIFNRIMKESQEQQQESALASTAHLRPKPESLGDLGAPPPEVDYTPVDPHIDNTVQSTDINAAKIRQAEGNNYGAYADIGDDAGISVGAYQFTEKSGMAQRLAKELGFKSIRDKGFKEAITTSAGRAAQDKLYGTYTKRPLEIGKQYGLDEHTTGFLIDTNVNGGLSSVLNRAKKMKGGVNLKNLKQARIDRYNYLIKKNPAKFSKFKNGWMNRVNEW